MKRDILQKASQICGLLFGCTDQAADLDEAAMRRIRAAQINAVVRLTPLTMTINVLNVAIVVYAFRDAGAFLFLGPWAAVILVAAVASLVAWNRSRISRPTGASARAITRMIGHASILAAAWGALPLVMFPGVDTKGQLIIACLVAGMISGGAFGLSTVPKAGLAYTWILTLAAATALFLTGEQAYVCVGLLLTIYGVFISRNLVAHGNMVAQQIRDQIKLEEQGEVIGLLLKDFQDHSSDWLWETNATGILIKVSERFVAAAHRNHGELLGKRMMDVVGIGVGPAPELVEFRIRMAARTPFRDVLVPVEINSQQHYWQLSAKPVFDAAGKFVGHRGVGADITARRMAEQRVNYLAHFDTLTDLPNLVTFRSESHRMLIEARERGKWAGLLCINLNQFKSINDTLGHNAGDALLKLVGNRIKSCTSNGDLVARLSGDEFAVLQIYPVQADGSAQTAQRLVDAFKSPFKLDHGDVVIGLSVGVAFAPADGWEADTLLKCAEMALYCARVDGTGTYRFFEPEMEAVAQRRHALEVGLRTALEKDGLELAFQPLVNLNSNAVAGFEALVRWNSPQWGAVSPAEFIPVAEASGLIGQLGEWVLRKAVSEAANWPGDITVAVNLSAVQLRNQKLLHTVVDALTESGLAPHRLELEVTESVFLDGSDQTMALLQNLRELGVRIALDDFGTGYSSLSYLRRFQFDKIKIDKSFIDGISSKEESAAIIKAIIALGDGLGMSTIAEGVENNSQIDRLRDLGCTQIQGFVYSSPRPACEVVGLLAQDYFQNREMAGSDDEGLRPSKEMAAA